LRRDDADYRIDRDRRGASRAPDKAASSRAACSFVQASAAALPVEPHALLEACAGLIEAAAGGTLLLTAVEEMPGSRSSR